MLTNVLKFTRAIFEEHEPTRFARRFLEALLEVQNVSRGSVWVKRGEDVVCIEAVGDQSEKVLGRQIPAGAKSVVGWVMENAKTTVAEAGKDPRHFGAMEDGLNQKSTLILCFPLILGDGSVYGAVEVIDTSAGGKRLNLRQDYLELLETLVAVGSVALGQALAFDRQARECQGLRRALDRFRGARQPVVGQSPAVCEALRRAGAYGRTDFPVLITGESGTGKELFAQAIHQASPRKDKPFFVQNCSAIPEALLESELFGYRKGAFTGADKDKQGLFEAANGGTVFLDEIGDMAPSLQAKVLRLIQNGEVKPLGAPATSNVDVRIISATNKNLRQAMEEGEFREDLFYRLNVLPLELPPLRERPEDIAELLDYFLKRDCLRMGMPAKRLAPGALARLCAHDWPGNIREMENLVKYLLTVVEGERIDEPDLPPHLVAAKPGPALAPAQRQTPPEPSPSAQAATTDQPLRPLRTYAWDELEKAYIVELCESVKWNISKASKLAGVNRSTFDSRLRKLGLSKG